MLLNGAKNIISTQGILPGPGRNFHNCLLWIKSVPPHLCFHGILIAGESTGLHDDLKPGGGRAVKRYHHEVKVHRKCIHHHHLMRMRAYESG